MAIPTTPGSDRDDSQRAQQEPVLGRMGEVHTFEGRFEEVLETEPEGGVDETDQHCEHAQDDQRTGHDPGRLVRVGAVGPASLPVEDEEVLASHVEGGQQGGQQPDRPEEGEVATLGEQHRQYLVLRPEPGQGWDARDGEGGHQHRRVGDGHLGPQPAHPGHVLLIGHGMDDGTRPEKQQGLEDGVSDQVEQAGHVSADPHRHEHVPELADSRVGQYPLDIPLGDGDGGRQ